MSKTFPKNLQDCINNLGCETLCVMYNDSKYFNCRIALDIITGETPDIINYLEFVPYDWITYISNTGMVPVDFFIYLGVYRQLCQMMSYWILNESGISISCKELY